MSAAGRLLLACAVALGGAAAASTLAQAGDALDGRLDQLERALRAADAAGLRAAVSRRARVHVDLRGLTDGQQVWAAGQLEVAFAEIFRAGRVVAFGLRRDTLSRAGDGLAFVRGHWTRQAAGGATEEGIGFTLRLEDGDWRVFEIRTTR